MLGRLIIIVLSVSFLAGCFMSPSTRIQVQRAPEIIIPDAKTVRVKTFSISSNSWGSDLRSVHRTDLQTALFNKQTFKVVSSGNADIVLGGTLNFITDDSVRQNTSTNSDGKKTTSYSVTRTGKLDVQLVVTDKSGNMVGTSNFMVVERSSASDKSEWRAKKNLRSNYELFSRTLKKSVGEIVKRVTPYTESVYRSFAEVDNEQFEKANENAENGLWEEALRGWLAAEKSGSGAKAASLFNQSIYYEQKGDLDTAYEKINQAVQLNSSSDFTRRKSQISKLIAEKESLKEHFKK